MLVLTMTRMLRLMAAGSILMALWPVAASAQGQFSVPTYVQLPIGSEFRSKLIVDVNADGVRDIVMQGMAVLLGPAYANPVFNYSPGGPYSVVPAVAADLNADGHIDIVASSVNGIFNYFGNSTGVFVNGPLLPSYANPSGRLLSRGVCEDIDADGNLEFIDNDVMGQCRIYTNVNGVWALATIVAQMPIAGGTALADVDGDGIRDLISCAASTVTPYTDLLAILKGLGNFAFGLPTTYFLPGNACTLTVADVDHDGCEDLIGHASSMVSLVRGSPAGLLPGQLVYAPPFAPPPGAGSWGGGGSYAPAIVADLNNDKREDMLWSNVDLWTITPGYYNQHIIHFGTGHQFSTLPIILPIVASLSASSVYVADFDNDGDVDICEFRGTYASPTMCDFGIFWNQSVYGPGISGTGVIPGISVGAAFAGNTAFSIGLNSALPGSAAALGLSLGSVQSGPSTGALWLNLAPGQLLCPNSAFGVVQVDALGMASVPLPLSTALPVGATVFAQWAVVDPMGQLLLSGVPPVALSPARKIICWQ